MVDPNWRYKTDGKGKIHRSFKVKLLYVRLEKNKPITNKRKVIEET